MSDLLYAINVASTDWNKSFILAFNNPNLSILK